MGKENEGAGPADFGADPEKADMAGFGEFSALIQAVL
jgi:hypothetical protein